MSTRAWAAVALIGSLVGCADWDTFENPLKGDCYFGCVTVEQLPDWIHVQQGTPKEVAEWCLALGHVDAEACSMWVSNEEGGIAFLPHNPSEQLVWHEAKHLINRDESHDDWNPPTEWGKP